MGFGEGVLGEVFCLLEKLVPPFGGTDLIRRKLLVGQVEVVALGVEARIGIKFRHCSIRCRALLEEVCAVNIHIVVGSIQA